MDDETVKVIAALFLLVFLIVIVIVGPFFTVWSVNHLFGTIIVMDFKTWCAMVWLIVVLRGINIVVRKNQ